MISITKKTPPIWDVIVIGGGPAGMMSALRAKERGLSVLLLEKNKKLGKKLLITGGGRCNITNATYDSRALLVKYKKAQKFLFSPFSQFAVFPGFPKLVRPFQRINGRTDVIAEAPPRAVKSSTKRNPRQPQSEAHQGGTHQRHREIKTPRP